MQVHRALFGSCLWAPACLSVYGLMLLGVCNTMSVFGNLASVVRRIQTSIIIPHLIKAYSPSTIATVSWFYIVGGSGIAWSLMLFPTSTQLEFDHVQLGAVVVDMNPFSRSTYCKTASKWGAPHASKLTCYSCLLCSYGLATSAAVVWVEQ